MLSSGTLARSRPRVSTPNATAAIGATRCDLKTVLTGRPPSADQTGMSQPYGWSVPRPLRQVLMPPVTAKGLPRRALPGPPPHSQGTQEKSAEEHDNADD